MYPCTTCTALNPYLRVGQQLDLVPCVAAAGVRSSSSQWSCVDRSSIIEQFLMHKLVQRATFVQLVFPW
eukprot:1410-Heterococcus_DN1.PRE.8